MISVITPTYNTSPSVLARTFASIKTQKYRDWEWVIWDDSTDDRVWNQVYGFMSDERYHVRAYRGATHSGSIGAAKRRGFMAAEGDILVELDHDDMLTPDALEKIAATSADFVFSDWAEILPDGQSGRYPDGWGYGHGKTYWDDNLQVWASSVDHVDDHSVQHIVSVPNHVRAWRSEFYHRIGGHNPLLDVCDDYELILRSYAKGTWEHIPAVLYKQYRGNTTQDKKNARIQELVPLIYKQFVLLK